MVTTGKIKVFVYGTLKKDHGLNKLLMRGRNVEYLGRNYIEEPLMLVDMGAYPALVEDNYDPDTKYKVFGELYTVDNETLASLDFAEGHPHFYKRKRYTMQDGPGTTKAWVYVMNDIPADYADEWIEDGMWKPSEGEKQYAAGK